MSFDDLTPIAPKAQAAEQPGTGKGVKPRPPPSPTPPAIELPCLGKPATQPSKAPTSALSLQDLDDYIITSFETLEDLASNGTKEDASRVTAAKALGEMALKVKQLRLKNKDGNADIDEAILRSVQARAMAKAVTGGELPVIPPVPPPWKTPSGTVAAKRELLDDD